MSERHKNMYIIVAILAFGILIATHELGHFILAKACGVKVNEFAVGMGPVLLKKQRGDTQYSLRALPIGGFCAMEGEDGESDDARSFGSQKVWKRFLILIAGPLMNFLTGLIIIILLFSGAEAFSGNTVQSLEPGFRYGGENGIMVGDSIFSIDGERVFYANDFLTYMGRSADGKVDMVVIRDGKKVKLTDYDLSKEEFVVNGETVEKYGISFNVIRATAAEKLKYSFYSAYDFVRLVKMGLSDLVTGIVGMKEMSGVVGIVSTINKVGKQSATVSAAVMNIAYLCAFIAINLSVMNLLPIPALDGGRVFFLVVGYIIEKITRRKLDPKYEAYINTVGLGLLMLLMVYVMFNDIVRIVHG